MTYFLVLLIYRAGIDAPPIEQRIAMPSLAECRVIADAINNRQLDARPQMEAKCLGRAVGA